MLITPDGDALPSISVYSDGLPGVITNPSITGSGGVYTISYVPNASAAGSIIQVRVLATVGGVTRRYLIREDQIEITNSQVVSDLSKRL